ncbi:glycosyltransferase [Roseiconus nitratireducens]|uniref:Glycosyltransferase n=2 Tax=Roseiconus nitratireducens TaxID=2605748 RepID=A0A5M6D5R2_9BACT|nr:glycosyltransferase [Roseiconus nitratireducens]
MASSMRGGGSERQVLLLARHLDRERFQPHLYLSDAVGDFLDQVPHDVPIHGYDAASQAPAVYVPGRALRRQAKYLRQVIRDAAIDVVYDRTFHMTLLAGSLAGNVRRVSTIVSPPDLALPMVESRFVEIKRRRLAAAYRRSDQVVAVSAQAAQSAESYYGLPEGSVAIVRNPVDVDGLRDAAEAATTPNGDRTLLVCVGRMTAEKGHRDLIAALPAVLRAWPHDRPPLQLRLIGDGPLRGEILRQVESLRLSNHVRSVGAVAGAAAEIASADALILPSRFEGMPNVVLEAMALGTAVIATRAGGAVELQRDRATAFWASPGDTDSIADAILRFARQPELAEQHRLAAKDLIRQEHDLRDVVRRIEDLLDPR